MVPFTSFSENETFPDGRKPPFWFAFDETRPLAFFAGIWTGWTSVRKGIDAENRATARWPRRNRRRSRSIAHADG
jgi:putative SOS response-associated peptidase YedK